MSDWWWPKQRQKKPPSAHGIKTKKAGTTWWGKRWIEVLEHVLLVDSGRLARGQTYAAITAARAGPETCFKISM